MDRPDEPATPDPIEGQLGWGEEVRKRLKARSVINQYRFLHPLKYAKRDTEAMSGSCI